MLEVDATKRRPVFDAAQGIAWRVGSFVVCLFLLLSVHPVAADSGKTAPVKPLPSRGESLLFEDLPEPLVPRTTRTESEEDHLLALARYAAGRTCQHRKEYAKAIRHYQRALRWEPAAAGPVWPIVALAEQLKWRDVRNRYLLWAARLDPGAFAPADLIELADLVSNEEELRLVTRLFEKALADRKDKKKTTLDIVLRWRLAEIYIAGEEYGKAADCAASVLDALENPQGYGVSQEKLKEWFGRPHPPYWLFGEYFFQADRLAEAETTFKKAQQAEPDIGRLYYQLARIELKRKKPDAAIKSLEACFREKFTDEGTEPYQLLKQALDQQGKSKELIARLEKLRTAGSDNAPLSCFLAEQYLESGQLDKAETLFTVLLKKHSVPHVYACLFKIYHKKGNVEYLLQVLGNLAAEDPSLDSLDEQIKTLAGDVVFRDKLLATARKRLSDQPAAFGARAPLAIAQLAIESKRPKDAEWFFELALRASPESASDVLLLWGGNLMAAEQYAKAADVFRRGANGKIPNADKSIFYYYLASALALNGQADEALAAVREACRLNQDSPLLASHEGWVLYQTRQNDKALKAYEQFVERFDNDHSSTGTRHVVREARLLLSHLEVQRKNYDKAAEWLEEVLDEYPDDVSAMNDLGYLWADQGVHLERALHMVRRAVDAEPNNAAYRDSLGWVLCRMGHLQEAVVILEKAAGELPEGEVLDHLGEVYFKLGKTQQAVETWHRAVEAHRSAHQSEAAKAVEKKLKKVAGK